MRRDDRNLRDAEIGISFQDPPHAAAGLEILNRDADRYAGGTTWTDRPIDNVVTPPEPRPRQSGIDFRRIGRGQAREQFTLDPAGQVGARHRAGTEELLQRPRGRRNDGHCYCLWLQTYCSCSASAPAGTAPKKALLISWVTSFRWSCNQSRYSCSPLLMTSSIGRE